MSTIFQQIQDDLKTAMKSGDKEKTQVLRLIFSDIKKEAVDSGTDRENISDEVSLQVLNKAQKTRKDSIKIYTDSGRKDLAEPEEYELSVIQSYLPQQLSDSELEEIISKVKAENPNLQGMAIMGKIMPLVKGRADVERIRPLL